MNCPACGYDLTGLPEEHQCPECGLRYDAASEVYRHTNPKQRFFGLFGFFGLSGFFGVSFPVMSFLGVGRSNASWAWLAALIFVSYFAAFAYLAYRQVRAYRRGPLVAVLPAGLYLRLQGDHGSLIAWADVQGSILDRKRRCITITKRDRMLPYSIGGVFKTDADAVRLSEQIEQRRRQCRGADNDKEADKP